MRGEPVESRTTEVLVRQLKRNRFVGTLFCAIAAFFVLGAVGEVVTSHLGAAASLAMMAVVFAIPLVLILRAGRRMELAVRERTLAERDASTQVQKPRH